MVGKTLKELNAQVGDVVQGCNKSKPKWVIHSITSGRYFAGEDFSCELCSDGYGFGWEILSRAPVIKYGEWKVGLEVTIPDNGADVKPLGDGWVAYREVVKPVVVVKNLFLTPRDWAHQGFITCATHQRDAVCKISVNIIDGVPDCDSVKMVKL